MLKRRSRSVAEVMPPSAWDATVSSHVPGLVYLPRFPSFFRTNSSAYRTPCMRETAGDGDSGLITRRRQCCIEQSTALWRTDRADDSCIAWHATLAKH